MIDGEWFFVVPDGSSPGLRRYDAITVFEEGHAGIRRDSVEGRLWGLIDEAGERFYIDRRGEPFTGDRFDWAYNFEAGLAHIAEGDFDSGMFGYIGDHGEVVWEPTH